MRRNFRPTPEDMERLVATLTQLLCASLENLMERSRARLQFPRMPAETSPYQVLGIDPSAADNQVRTAYKFLAHRLHPDHGGSNQAMARLNQAYDQIARERGWRTK